MNRVEEFLQIMLAASEARKEAALRVLRGHAIAIDPAAEPRPYEPLLTRREAARRLGVTAQTLRRWKVPGIPMQGGLRFRLSDIEAYLATDDFKRRRAALRAAQRISAKGASKQPTPQTANP
jgi:hypothetical protein